MAHAVSSSIRKSLVTSGGLSLAGVYCERGQKSCKYWIARELSQWRRITDVGCCGGYPSRGPRPDSAGVEFVWREQSRFGSAPFRLEMDKAEQTVGSAATRLRVDQWRGQATPRVTSCAQTATTKCRACNRRHAHEFCCQSSDTWDPSRASLHPLSRGTLFRSAAGQSSRRPLPQRSSSGDW